MLKMSIAKDKLSTSSSRARRCGREQGGDGAHRKDRRRPARSGQGDDGQGRRAWKLDEDAWRRRRRSSLSRSRRTRMAGFADYEAYDALGLADLVRRRKVTPTELLDAAIERVEARNPTVNAVVLPLYDYARKAIADGLPDGPLRGVPYLLKDLTASLAGVKTMRGSRFFADTPPAAADSEHVARLKRCRAWWSSDGPARASSGSRSPASRSSTAPRRTRGTRPHLGRLERRRGRRHRRPHRADRARERRLRIDPRARRVLRARRAQADPRAEHDGAVHRRGPGRLSTEHAVTPRRSATRPRSSMPPRGRGRATRTPLRRRPGRSSPRSARPPGRLRDRVDRARAQRRAGGPRLRGARPGDRRRSARASATRWSRRIPKSSGTRWSPRSSRSRRRTRR